MKISAEQVAAFERFVRERFGIEPGVDENGTHYYERWQIDEALARERKRAEAGHA
jgi:hypothetical protein